MKYLMGIDIGTSGTKTALFDHMGNMLASYTGEYEMYQPDNGYAEEAPEDWWKATTDGIHSVIMSSGIDAGDIAGIGLSGQMHSLVMLDENSDVLRRAILWCDQRTAAECAEITDRVGAKRLIEITANPALTGFTASKILWVRNHERGIYEKCRHIMLAKDYIRFKLTGEFATEVSDASGMQLLDIAGRCWSEEVLEKLEIDKNLLCKVYESPEVTGRVTAETAKMTGLREGTIVVGGAGDNAAAAVGTGVVRDGRAFTTIGTSGVVFAHTDNLSIDMKGRVHSFCCAVPGKWHVMGVTQAAGLSVKWFKDNFCSEDIKLAANEDLPVYKYLDKKAEELPIGANGLIYLPYLMGERTPHLDADCRGVFFGLSAMHTRYDMMRAVMEGVTYSLSDCLSVLREMGVTASEMIVCGGGASSRFWRQMLCDNFACHVKIAVSSESAVLGVALLAAVGAGIYKSVEDACDTVLKYRDEISPNMQNHEKYMKYYEIYKGLYPSLKESFKSLK